MGRLFTATTRFLADILVMRLHTDLEDHVECHRGVRLYSNFVALVIVGVVIVTLRSRLSALALQAKVADKWSNWPLRARVL